MNKYTKWVSWVLQAIVAIILLQTLYFKFTSQPVSIELFSILGVEPWGRYLVGIIELVTGVMLLVPATIVIGATLAVLVGAGAILTHIFFIGIDFGGDISLFLLAIAVLVLSAIILYLRLKKDKIKYTKNK